MMVIQVTNTSAATITVAGFGIRAGRSANFPADRCVFEVDQVSGGYNLGGATFYDGQASAPAALITADLDAQLGYIGKSGRFVAITT